LVAAKVLADFKENDLKTSFLNAGYLMGLGLVSGDLLKFFRAKKYRPPYNFQHRNLISFCLLLFVLRQLFAKLRELLPRSF